MRELTSLEKKVLLLAQNIIKDAYKGDIFKADLDCAEYKVFAGITDIIYEENIRTNKDEEK